MINALCRRGLALTFGALVSLASCGEGQDSTPAVVAPGETLTMLCRGGPEIIVDSVFAVFDGQAWIRYGGESGRENFSRLDVSIEFRPAPTPAGIDGATLSPSTCSPVDREFRADEPLRIHSYDTPLPVRFAWRSSDGRGSAVGASTFFDELAWNTARIMRFEAKRSEQPAQWQMTRFETVR